ncbi:hypothetical protein L484_006942 [Morus notabilis]|uniref:Uncharacterized protein n=1 Tax=Morus notabilis TaxID=981085 RepID=W9QYT4_9ROSA|nr:hypothetical protein L484_006942 [Morus notabilis]
MALFLVNKSKISVKIGSTCMDTRGDVFTQRGRKAWSGRPSDGAGAPSSRPTSLIARLPAQAPSFFAWLRASFSLYGLLQSAKRNCASRGALARA